ncbi:MAG: polysaccharide deacetylase family protein [Magnetococcales bacterium]|nr:polysaccharide deacetylase family protein [Magnetococcales bacterium]
MAYGIMFHHFHDAIHPQGQGAISADDLKNLLGALNSADVLDAPVWLEKAMAGTLEPHHRCLTFDDALLCQYDIALPVLKQFGKKAFWFIYSSIFQGNLEPLELYRYFRTVAFATIDDFYLDFFAMVTTHYPAYKPHITSDVAVNYLADFSFYTRNDRIFRHLRDEILTTEAYAQLMTEMMAAHHFDTKRAVSQLWMNPDHLVALHQDGHIIGLHSNSHPTRLGRLPPEQQLQEYVANTTHLERLLGVSPCTMAHPCNSYNPDTLRILQSLGVKIGFRSNRAEVEQRTLLEMPREDHINLLSAQDYQPQ